ncbi:uncharacterized protein SPAPADRAFT_52219 [Spathaspora passalidarum NRRL Y-27907]|uniref:BRCT domain-containing protein n=1 Tax=Spathaspora passalidarum (strain NRRL Y-27907 / 11-Y1) TaxID=619300 RepID=G3AS77_SPAPN|nr:uncharacterized protein SPAPADRAFT_52219 [Spathaspora passalidarum NRRL Y-27907]EGW31036.1 hypothetical protein SPAPADRAFT_52219 [Spathaspora passalidarum NRRL Y-27907]
MKVNRMNTASNPTQQDEETHQVNISSLKIREDYNSSLVFGNDQSQIHPDITELDQTQCEIFNEDIFSTPSKKENGSIPLSYLQDTQVIEQEHIESPKSQFIGDTQVIDSPSSSDQKTRVRHVPNLPEISESPVIASYETETPSSGASHDQVRRDYQLQDTQIINNDQTQRIDDYTQRIDNDFTQQIDNYTQRIDNNFIQQIDGDTQAFTQAQTQLIDQTQKIKLESFQFSSGNQETQPINQNGNISTSSPEKQTMTSSPQLLVPPPEFISHTQVLNTQEQADITTTSQGNNDTLEVQSDDEQESENKQFEDSLLATRLKRKMSQPGSPIKRLKRNQTTMEIPEMKTPVDLRMKSEPIVLASPSTLTSQSSPPVQLVKRTSSPTKETDRENTTIPDDEEVEETTIPDEEPTRIHPPSSPQFNIPFEDGSSESEDIDDVDEPIPGKRRIRNIIDSQPTMDETTFDESNDTKVLRVETSNVLTQDDIVNHNSVWATYNNLKIYSGTVVNKDIEYSNVDFRDGIYRIKNTDLKLLDIRIGDTLNIRNSAHKYVVTGLGCSESSSFIQCIRGYNVVYLCKFPSKPKDHEFRVSLSECFMEVDDWALHESNYQLIIESHDLLSDTVPLTPTKTNKFIPFISQVSSKASPLRRSTHERTSLFSGRLFCITGIVGDRKNEIKQMIENNDGTLIDRELNEIFQYSTVGDSLVLQSDYLAGLSFGALISNSYCRSAKYLQALALGWPILSDVYIDDCINDSSTLEAWPGYLLPSGQSKRLNAVKSYDVFKFRKNYECGAMLNEQLSLNNNLLHGIDVIILTINVNANSLETSKLIFHSFGARSLQYCSKSGQIQKLFKSLGGDIIVYDDGNTINKVLSNMASRNIKKQKESKKVKVVDWEWLVQCVIGGIIWKSPTYTIDI